MFCNNGNLVLNCDSVKDGENTGLIFNAENAIPVSSKGKLNIFSAGTTIWNSNGLSRAWNSVSYDHVPSSQNRGLVNNFNRKKKKN